MYLLSSTCDYHFCFFSQNYVGLFSGVCINTIILYIFYHSYLGNFLLNVHVQHMPPWADFWSDPHVLHLDPSPLFLLRFPPFFSVGGHC